MENRGNKLHINRAGSLRLNYGSKSDSLVQGHAQILHTSVHIGSYLVFKVLADLFRHVLGILFKIELVGVGEEIALHLVELLGAGSYLLFKVKAKGGGVEHTDKFVRIANACVLQLLGSVNEPYALGERDVHKLSGVDSVLLQRLYDVSVGHVGVELVAARYVSAVRTLELGIYAEDNRSFDDALALQNVRNGFCARVFGYLNRKFRVGAAHSQYLGGNGDDRHRTQYRQRNYQRYHDKRKDKPAVGLFLSLVLSALFLYFKTLSLSFFDLFIGSLFVVIYIPVIFRCAVVCLIVSGRFIVS